MKYRGMIVFVFWLATLGLGAHIAAADSIFHIAYDHVASPTGDHSSPETTLRSLAYDSTGLFIYGGYIHGQQTRYVKRYSVAFGVDGLPAVSGPIASYNFGIDPVDNTTGLGLQPMSLAFLNGYLYVGATTDPGDGLSHTSPTGLYVLSADLSTSNIAPAPAIDLNSTRLGGLAIDGAKLYAAYGNTIYRYDLTTPGTPTLDGTWSPLTLANGGTPAGALRGMQVTSGYLFAPDKDGNRLYRVNLSDQSFISIALNAPMDVTSYVDGSSTTHVLVSHFAADPTAVYDVSMDMGTVTPVTDPGAPGEIDRYKWFGSTGGYTGIEADPAHVGRYFLAADNMLNDINRPNDAQGRDRIYYDPAGAAGTPELDPLLLALMSLPTSVLATRARRRIRRGSA